MREIQTEIAIDARASPVWEVLAEVSRFPEWNPVLKRTTGELAEGKRIVVTLEPPGGKPSNFKPRIVRLEAGHELRWLGHVLVPGLFDGEHIFTVEPQDGNSVRFVQREEFTGLLAGPLLRMIGERTKQGFEAMNEALKARAENGDG